MAEIDPRLIELVDTLVAAGADWLAFEIFDGIRSGRPVQEPDDHDRGMHRSLRSWKDDKSSPPGPRIRETRMQAIDGDDQIEFAASYVVERITEAVEMTRISLDNLNLISTKPTGSAGEVNPASETAITLGLEGSEFRIKRDETEKLARLLPDLRTSVSNWAARVRKEQRGS